MAFKRGITAEKRYRMAMGSGNSWKEEENFSKNNDSCPFNTDAEETLWRYYNKTPMMEPFKEGKSMVGKRKSGTDHHEVHEAEPEPIMDDFESDSDHFDVSSKRKRITESVLLEEKYKLRQASQLLSMRIVPHNQDTVRFFLALIATGPGKTASTTLYRAVGYKKQKMFKDESFAPSKRDLSDGQTSNKLQIYVLQTKCA
ncbi:unnamed protein product [Cylicocyclus nassatus]|uniref:Uncharacterized protein n=1 Tax=Cylicocyclus nassatus TaxID=53992 RepID=A0AA36HD08_CYLNA|nr:unnamed protein product [Cylicocyclus nassatus]